MINIGRKTWRAIHTEFGYETERNTKNFGVETFREATVATI
jgi:hypothetical protein